MTLTEIYMLIMIVGSALCIVSRLSSEFVNKLGLFVIVIGIFGCFFLT